MKLVSLYETRAQPCTDPIGMDGETLRGIQAVMEAHKGIGIAAPQCGVYRRFFIVDLRSRGGQLHWFFNPEMKPLTAKTELRKEGCLTLPGEVYEVRRFLSVALRFQNVWGEWVNWPACKGLLAYVVQHEMDHLEGKCIRDVGKKVDESKIVAKGRK